MKDEFKMAQNSYYYIIRKAKRLCWQKSLQKEKQPNYYWIALKYIKPLQLKITPTLKDLERNTTTFIRVKEVLVYKLAFSKPPINFWPDPKIEPETTHIRTTKSNMSQALFCQLATKAVSPNKINFLIVRMIWSRDKLEIIRLV